MKKNKHVRIKSIIKSPGLKGLKIFLLVAFGFLLVADIIFVIFSSIPTISQVVADSSPRYIVLIWLFGVATANVFFPKFPGERVIRRTYATPIMIVLFISLAVFGLTIQQNTYSCQNYKEFQTNKFYTMVVKHCVDGDQYCRKINPGEISSSDCISNGYSFKIDFRTEIKLVFLLSGLLSGYFFWPQTIQEEMNT